MSQEKSNDIKEKIHSLDLSISNYWQILNQEGIWLFLATLGAWSVSEVTLQYSAAILIFVIFASRVYNRAKENGFFSTQIKEIENEIENFLDNDSDVFKARRYDLEIVKSKLSAAKSLRNTIIYFLCATFFGVSVGYWTGLIEFL